MTLPTIMISAGDPFGIGPEVVARAMVEDAELRASARWRIFAPGWIMQRACELIGAAEDAFDEYAIEVIEPAGAALGPRDQLVGVGDCAEGGRVSHAQVEMAIEAVKAERGSCALVTAPISKTAWRLAGRDEHPGHTELLAARFGVDRAVMMFVGPRLRVSLVTVHLPLARAIEAVTTPLVLDTIEKTHEAMRRLGSPSPRIGVCGLNPHAGEGGLLGEEDQRVIAPAVDAARDAGIDAGGPFPADALFVRAAAGKVDAVVAMYHDQGLIPAKMLDRDEAVNVTLGLGAGDRWATRTSPAHGTAFDIAWTGAASADSMKAAMRSAVNMAPGSTRA